MQRLSLILFLSLESLHMVLGVQNAACPHSLSRCNFKDEPPISCRNLHTHWNHDLDGVIKEHLLQRQPNLNQTCSTANLLTTCDNFNGYLSKFHGCTDETTESSHCQRGFGISYCSQTSSCFRHGNFQPPLTSDRDGVFSHASEADASGKTWSFIHTLDIKAWTAILGLIFAFSLLKILDNRLYIPVAYEQSPNSFPRLRSYVYYRGENDIASQFRNAFELMLPDEQGVENWNIARQWFVDFILAICALLLVLSCEAYMVASLVQESTMK